MDGTPHNSGDPHAWKKALVGDLGRIATRDRWGRALMLVGWLHLAFFLVCHAVYDPGWKTNYWHPILWVVEVGVIVALLRRVLGPGWWCSTPMAGIVVRVWATFLILTFSVCTLNTLTGWAVDWFKLAWGTLSSFGFATMAWLLSPWFLVCAFQMYFTALTMVRFPHQNYLIFGLSWWAALQGIGLVLEHRAGRTRGTPAPAPAPAGLVEAGAWGNTGED